MLVSQALAFPLSSLSVMPWAAQSMMVPIVNTLAVFSTIDVGVDAALPLFISAFVWITCAFGLAVFVGLSYTRDRFSNMFPVKVRIGDRVAVCNASRWQQGPQVSVWALPAGGLVPPTLTAVPLLAPPV